MKKIIATVLGLAAASAVYGQGTIASLANSLGATIYPIFDTDGTTKLAGANYKVEVFLFGTEAAPFGTQLGTTASTISATGRFNAGSSVAVPGKGPGTTAQLIVRAWDTTKPGGGAYDTAAVRGKSLPFTTDLLGGDPDGDGPLLPITPKGMVTGTAAGFQSFSLVPEPTTIALGALGAAALLLRRRK